MQLNLGSRLMRESLLKVLGALREWGLLRGTDPIDAGPIDAGLIDAD